MILLDKDSLVHVRLAPSKTGLRLIAAKAYRLPEDTFNGGLVTPDLVNDDAIADVLRRLRMETGKWDRVSVLLPDSWFRMNILDVPSIPDKESEALEVVRWSLKRTLPIPPEELRIARQVLSVTPGGAKVLAVSAREKTLAAIERIFTAAGLDIVLIEPAGLNIWNAITVREKETTGDRLFLYVRERDFTTAVFRGNQPVFLRSRNLNADRSLEQEIRLSASYLREALSSQRFETCYVAGDTVDAQMVIETVSREFNSPVKRVTATEFAPSLPSEAAGYDAAISASAGVFA